MVRSTVGMSTANSRIPVTRDTRKRLASLKRGGETYEELLTALIEESDRQSVEPQTAY
jgi:hypothetical protein